MLLHGRTLGRQFRDEMSTDGRTVQWCNSSATPQDDKDVGADDLNHRGTLLFANTLGTVIYSPNKYYDLKHNTMERNGQVGKSIVLRSHLKLDNVS